ARIVARTCSQSAVVGNVDQYRQSHRRGGDEAGSGCGAYVGPRNAPTGNPTSRRYRARIRGDQGSGGRTLCPRRSADGHQPRSHQHLSAGRTTADSSRPSRIRRSGRPDVLWTKRTRPVPSRRRHCRQDSARGEAGRHPSGAADQVRSRHQSYDCQGAWTPNSRHATRARRRGDRMKRREFITLVGSAAATWPLAARAQQRDGVRVVGVLMGNESGPEPRSRIAAFRKALRDSGWVDDRNVSIRIVWGPGDSDSVRADAVELVGKAPDVILANGPVPVLELQKLTRTIPIVF